MSSAGQFRGLHHDYAVSSFPFPTPQDLLALTPEDLGGAIIEVVPPLIQNGLFSIHSFLYPLYESPVQSYPRETRRSVMLAFAEALSWLTAQGLSSMILTNLSPF